MLSPRLKKRINLAINNVEVSRESLRQVTQVLDFGSADLFDIVYDKAFDNFERDSDDLDVIISQIWARNLDLSIQKSLNYYLKKAGLMTREITAII